MVKETATNSIAVKSGGSIDMKLLTLSDPALVGPFMTRGVGGGRSAPKLFPELWRE